MNFSNYQKIEGTILLTGESGTGKSYFARQFHQKKKPENPFIEVNLASLQDNLLESELFGHEKGAFTGAFLNKRGFFDIVGKGTLFLDEIGELSLSSQKKLLGVLEEKYYYPIGSTIKKKFEGQLIAATNKNLPEMVSEKTFREDLYYRLKVFTYELPPLRQTSDLMTVIKVLLKDHFGREIKIDESCLGMLKSYKWPGNIRELKHALEYALTFCDSCMRLEHLPPWILNNADSVEVGEKLTPILGNYYLALSDFEQIYFRDSLDFCEGKINKTAKYCGLSKATLLTKLKKYEINTWSIKAKYRELKLAS